MLRTQASKRVLAVDVHGTAAADALAATPTKRESRIYLVFNADERIEHHRSRLAEVELVGLHARLLVWFVRVPSVDLECLVPHVSRWDVGREGRLGLGLGHGGHGPKGGRNGGECDCWSDDGTGAAEKSAAAKSGAHGGKQNNGHFDVDGIRSGACGSM